MASTCTKSTTFVSFQYRLVLRILPTNMFLTQIGIKQDTKCSFRNNAPENYIHLFWHCTKVKLFWTNLMEKLLDVSLTPQNYPRDITVFFGLRSDSTKFSLQLNFCFLLARYYIWCSKTSNKTPNLITFLTILKSQFNIETYKLGSTPKK